MTRFTKMIAAAAVTVTTCGTPWTDPTFGQADKASAEKTSPADAQTAAAKTSSGGATTQPSAFLLVVPIPVQRVAPAILPYAGALAPDGEAIRDTLASATEAALTEDGFNDFVERLVDADRNRIGKFDPGSHSALNAAAERVREAWEAKFGDDLDISEEDDVYAPLSIVQGVINTGLEPAVKSMPANTSADYNLEPGRDVAVVTMPARHGLSETTLVMIEEALGWKIDVPNTMSGNQIHANLIQRLNAVADAAGKWPKNRQAAARYLTHQVLLSAVAPASEQQTASAQQQ